ncbi:FAD binding domain-containing protein [Treponema sp.]|uniref:FAD binding domain-containing protein n=1 Tax=Treponema sp. TaxID=166 RepID=UPI00298DC073|nr:FAD binding domain-containing protein [Treponema sp.]MCR5612086.1 FAD binding domain-containing protein [Treponema sp.]
MATDKHMVFTAKNVNDILFQLKTVSNLKIIGGATYIHDLSEKSLSIRNIPELAVIDKHERYIDFGPAVTLNKILHMGINFLPKVLYEAILTMGNHAVRNMATLGGNLMAKDYRLTLPAPLIALDASLKFRGQKNFEIIPLEKFSEMPEGSVLVNIRIPTEDWNVEVFRRLGPTSCLSDLSASFCFLASTEKNVITSLRLCFTGPFVFTSKELETKYLGARLPLTNSIIEDFIQIAEKKFDELAKDKNCDPLLKQQFLNLTAYSLHELT